ncbi:hypothetical protein M413DRAFT_445070 [Hebeloma cylindrosporum]|uniref:Nudix hydrolase domain-containing protein n=1 Tax=Hebeloma cylindrosporum TaxID=76867 RepID=A0A0C3BZ42_HEBCY|nr:hypothetical protein M413DRAFT_445070 [Hebeloma cylindrosporum h7]
MTAPDSHVPQIASQRAPPRPRVRPPPLTKYSTPGVEDCAWSSLDFMLGAGMVIIQQHTHKIVVVFETREGYWFFPRGRKDIGESLEKAALREAYEESGYRAQFLPLMNPTRQPPVPGASEQSMILNTEPIYMTITASQPSRTRAGQLRDLGREYLTTWYVGQIPEDAVAETGTGMPDEQNYQSHLLSFEEAFEKVWGSERRALRYAWQVYCWTYQHFHPQDATQQSSQSEATDQIPFESLEVSEPAI